MINRFNPWLLLLVCIRQRGWPRSATPTKRSWWLCSSIALLAIASCSSQNNPTTTETASSDAIVSSTPPFQTKEPERYRATRTITIITNGGEPVVTKSSIARYADMRRNEFETASKRIAYLDLPDGRFVLLIDDKVYADLATETGALTTEEEEVTPERLLHTDSGTTSYQKIGTEVVGGRNSNKYRAVVNNSSAGNVSVSETFIWIDETLNMPIRSETSSADGTRITMELSDVVLDVDKSIFQVPEDYEKVAFNALRKRLQTRSAG